MPFRNVSEQLRKKVEELEEAIAHKNARIAELQENEEELASANKRLSRQRDEAVNTCRRAVEQARRSAGMSAAGKGSLMGLAIGALVFAVTGNAGALIGIQLVGAIFGAISGYAAPASSRTMSANRNAAHTYGRHH